VLDLNDLQVFERVAALHGFSEAARALGLPKSNVSRSVARLEAALGARLFHRSTRDVTLTAAGVALRDRARDIIERAGEALDYVGSLAHGPRGSIKVNSGIGFGLNVLGSELPRFLQRYPDVDVTLDLESRAADLVSEAIDVAVRVGTLQDSSLIAVRLGAMRRYLCASRSYVERCGRPNSIEELKDHDVIEMPGADGRPRPWVFTRVGEQSSVALHPRVTVNEALTVHRLVSGGAGLGIISGYVCAPAIADGALIRLLPDWSASSLEVSLVFPSRRELSPAVRAFTEFMKEISRPGELWQNDPLEVAPL
jgi:LysR family transcriptional regulator for bpeEF and oprC